MGRSNHRARRWVPYLAGLLLLAAVVAGLWPQPVLIEVATVSVGPLRATVNEEGKTRIKQRFTVSAPLNGALQRIPFKAGAPVVAGQTVVAVMEPLAPNLLDARARSSAEARRDTATANLEKARAADTFAASELARFKKLYNDNTISIEEFESAQMRAASSAKELAAAQSALRQAQAELAEFTADAADPPGQEIEVKAPVTGRILKVFEENARVVTAGTPLVEVGDPTDLEVVIEVLSRDGAIIPPGAKVEFDDWGGPTPLEGRVRLVEPAAFTKVSALGVEEQRVNVIADFVTPPEQRATVGDNFRVEARIITWEDNQALQVPAGALFRQGDEWATFVVIDGRAELRRVKAGHSSGTQTQVLEGLKPGEQVILYPGSRVQPGQRVRAIKI
jgi:HlyD family secretion protein